MISLLQLGAMLCVIWMPYTDTLTVGLLVMLTMRPRQIAGYLILLWWLSLWAWAESGGLYFMPEQAIYLMGIVVLFLAKPRGKIRLMSGE